MKIKGAIFDMDGTLVDSLSFWGYLWSEIGKKYFDNEDFLPDSEIDRMARTMIYDEAMIYFKITIRFPVLTMISLISPNQELRIFTKIKQN